jgi:hypothetical protein
MLLENKNRFRFLLCMILNVDVKVRIILMDRNYKNIILIREDQI